MRTLWAGILFLALSLPGAAGWANVSLAGKTELASQGIEGAAFSVIEFSPDGRSVLGFQQARRADVAQGITGRLFLLQLRSDGKVSGVRAYNLSIPTLEQAAFTPDGREVVLITASGAAFVALDLATGQVRTLMAHEPRQPGFRSHPPVMWRANGRLLARGYFYDQEDYGGENAIAEVDPAKTGLEAFQLRGEVTPAERALKNVAIYAFTDPQTGYFCTAQDGRETLYRWVAGSPPVAFDEGVGVTGFMPHGDQLAYAIKRASGQHEVVVYDGATGTSKVLGTSQTPFHYLTFSHDGSTVQVNHIEGERMMLFSASSRAGWTLKPVPGLPRCQVGDIRLSSDGRRMSLYGQDGLRIIDLP